VNDVLANAVDEFASVIKAERSKSQYLSDKDVAAFLREF